eukprot:GHVQ01001692.1.p1 GENE.GHVQ01001692.1~~GHVQ01001692.1.p1  ORF type:complete len:422 (+),score=67.64 GHVQ01001692.1:258-1523(+)
MTVLCCHLLRPIFPPCSMDLFSLIPTFLLRFFYSTTTSRPQHRIYRKQQLKTHTTSPPRHLIMPKSSSTSESSCSLCLPPHLLLTRSAGGINPADIVKCGYPRLRCIILNDATKHPMLPSCRSTNLRSCYVLYYISYYQQSLACYRYTGDLMLLLCTDQDDVFHQNTTLNRESSLVSLDSVGGRNFYMHLLDNHDCRMWIPTPPSGSPLTFLTGSQQRQFSAFPDTLRNLLIKNIFSSVLQEQPCLSLPSLPPRPLLSAPSVVIPTEAATAASVTATAATVAALPLTDSSFQPVLSEEHERWVRVADQTGSCSSRDSTDNKGMMRTAMRTTENCRESVRRGCVSENGWCVRRRTSVCGRGGGWIGGRVMCVLVMLAVLIEQRRSGNDGGVVETGCKTLERFKLLEIMSAQGAVTTEEDMEN